MNPVHSSHLKWPHLISLGMTKIANQSSKRNDLTSLMVMLLLQSASRSVSQPAVRERVTYNYATHLKTQMLSFYDVSIKNINNGSENKTTILFIHLRSLS